MVAGQPVELPETKKFFVGFIGRKDKPHALSHAEHHRRLGHRLVEYAENPPLYWDVMGRHRYIFRSPDESDIHDLAAAARQTG
jgi:hypothetical protein